MSAYIIEPGHNFPYYTLIDWIYKSDESDFAILSAVGKDNELYAIKVPRKSVVNDYKVNWKKLTKRERDQYMVALRNEIDMNEAICKALPDHAIRIVDYGQDQPWVSMALAGDNIPDALERLEGIDSDRVILDVVETVARLHKAGFVHLNINPDVFYEVDDGWAIGDFDYSGRLYKGCMPKSVPRAAGFLAPEQCQAIRNGSEPLVDARTDVFQLGALIYYMKTGKTVFSEETYVKAAIRCKPALTEIKESLIRSILSIALSKNPAERYNDASELLEELKFAIVYQQLGLHEYIAEINKYDVIFSDNRDPIYRCTSSSPESDCAVGKNLLKEEKYDLAQMFFERAAQNGSSEAYYLLGMLSEKE